MPHCSLPKQPTCIIGFDDVQHCPFDRAEEYNPHPISGVYAICLTNAKAAKNREVWYVGKPQDFSDRMRRYLQDGSRILTPAQMKKLAVSFGIIHALEGNRSVSPEDIHSIESLLQFKIKPKGNASETCERYTGKRPILIGNVGELKSIDKTMTSIHDLDVLLNKKRPTKKRKATSDPPMWPKLKI